MARHPTQQADFAQQRAILQQELEMAQEAQLPAISQQFSASSPVRGNQEMELRLLVEEIKAEKARETSDLQLQLQSERMRVRESEMQLELARAKLEIQMLERSKKGAKVATKGGEEMTKGEAEEMMRKERDAFEKELRTQYAQDLLRKDLEAMKSERAAEKSRAAAKEEALQKERYKVNTVPILWY